MLLQIKEITTIVKADSLSNAKVVHDTIRVIAKELEPLELINKVDTFYNNAWTKLVIILPVLIGVVAVLIPFLTAQYQKREMKHSEEKLISDIEKQNKLEIEKLKTELEERSTKSLDKLKVELKVEYDSSIAEISKANASSLNKLESKMLTIIEAEGRFSQGLAFSRVRAYNEAAYSFLYAAVGFYDQDRRSDGLVALKSCCNQLANVKREELEAELVADNTSIEKETQILNRLIKDKVGKEQLEIFKFKISELK